MKTISSASKETDADDSAVLLRKAREAAVRFIGISTRSSGAVAASLTRAGFGPDIVEHTVSDLERDGYIRNEVVARRILKEADERAIESYAALKSRMTRLGVPDPIAEQVLEGRPVDVVTAEKLIGAAFSGGPDKTDDPRVRRSQAKRMVRLLASRGYDPDTIEEAVRKTMGDMDD